MIDGGKSRNDSCPGQVRTVREGMAPVWGGVKILIRCRNDHKQAKSEWNHPFKGKEGEV